MANAGNPGAVLDMGEVQAAARTLGLEVASFEIRRAEDIAPAFQALKGRAEALYMVSDPLIGTNRIGINTLALSARLPTIYAFRENVGAGGLSPMDQTSRTCSGAPPTMSTGFCAARIRPKSPWSSRPSSISPSI
jgi:ABC-type uncharacterized transport system substrate-binding protein